MPFDASPVWISLKTAGLATVLTMFFGVLAARWRVARTGRLYDLLDGVFLLPLVLPPTVVGYFLLLLFSRTGPLGSLLERAGITIVFSWSATVIAAAVVAFPLMYQTARGALDQVDPALLGAARTLGASEWGVFRRVTLPLAWPGLLAGTILAFARALGEFGATLMLAGNIPGRTQTLPVAIFFAVEGGRPREALAWVLLLVSIALIVVTAMAYWSRQQRGLSFRTRRHARVS